MESFMTVLSWVGYAFAIVGVFGTVWKTVHTWRSLKSFSWTDVEKSSKRIIRKMQDDGFYPDNIVTIGRGGAILGALISGNLHSRDAEGAHSNMNIPVLGCDRIYHWQFGERSEVKEELIDFAPLGGKRVLLVAGDVLTGGTMKSFLSQLREVGPVAIKSACLAKGITAAFTPDYVGKEIPGDFRMPWMYKGFGYIRDSREPHKHANI